MQRLCPEILIISDIHDYSTDFVTNQLNKCDASYLRLNRDQFKNFRINLIPAKQKLFGETEKFIFEINPKILKSIYFRAPIYLRDNYQPNLSLNDQLSRNQWASFIRALILFDNVLWVNNPHATYKAEIKPYQLYLAEKIGFKIPNTIIANDIPPQNFVGDKLILKTLDPALLNLDGKEGFVYTNIVSYKELKGANLSSTPVIFQEPLIPKIDIRVTVIDETVFAVTIKKNNKGIDIDWRLEKDSLDYSEIKIPYKIENKCIKLLKELDLKFGAIDLVIYGEDYYFIEINPTGEWSWLMSHTDLAIDKTIAELLIKGK